jgi:hypothetical protein
LPFAVFAKAIGKIPRWMFIIRPFDGNGPISALKANFRSAAIASLPIAFLYGTAPPLD